MTEPDKPLAWLAGEVRTPPFSSACVDLDATWPILYHIAADAIVILDVFSKTTRTTPKQRLDEARRRLAAYHAALEEG